ncbi:MAG TPA: universal stress protein [Hyphomicrobiaceae bacterium]|jgi:nucleotide-binding universal stress UspA family protein
MIKTILVLADGSPGCEIVLSAAVDLSRRFTAHLNVLHVRPADAGLMPYIGEGMSAAMVEEIIEAAERNAEERAASARTAFDRLNTAGLSASWHAETGPEADIAAAVGRLSDLIVIGRPDDPGEIPWRTTLDSILFDTGRPVLILPRNRPSDIGSRVAVAWNSSAEAAGAVAAALPFFRSAEQVTILSTGPVSRYASAAGLVTYLARHDVRAATKTFEPGSTPLGNALLEQCRLSQSDLLVMGAYGHSRLREMILGGATREVLAIADLPVLMAH